MTMATRFSSVTMIANPVSGNGKTAGRIAEIRDRLRWTLLREVELVTTRFPGDALQSVRALRRGPGSALLIVLGGDGTVQEVANGLMHLPDSDRSRITLGLISSGTGQGLAQSIGLAEDVGTQIQQFPFLHTRPFDLGHVFLSGSDDTVRDRYFVNECQAGIGGEVVRRVEHSGRKALGGRLTFGLTALRVAMYHPNQVVRLSLDHGQAEVVNVTGLFVGNGQFTGGGMNLAPGALPWDGRLDLLIMKKQSFTNRVTNLRRVYSGRHVQRPQFELRPFRHLEIDSTESVCIEADGEYLGVAPVTIHVVPGALQILAAGARP